MRCDAPHSDLPDPDQQNHIPDGISDRDLVDEHYEIDESDLVRVDEGRLVSSDNIRLVDIVCRRGGHNVYNRFHQDFLDKRDTYHALYKTITTRKMKHKYRNELIRWVYRRKGRFLKLCGDNIYRVMTLPEVKSKVSAVLREERKKNSSWRTSFGKFDNKPPLAVPHVEEKRPCDEATFASLDNDIELDLSDLSNMEEFISQKDDYEMIEKFFMM